MKKILTVIVSVCFIAAMLAGCSTSVAPTTTLAPVFEATATAVPTPEPTAVPTPEPEPEIIDEDTVIERLKANAQQITGTVIEMDDNNMILNTTDGNTILFTLTYISDSNAAAGDNVIVTYLGDLLESPEALEIEISSKSFQPQISGTILKVNSLEIFIQISSSEAISFYLTPETELVGADYLVPDDAVTVTYTGSIAEGADAVKIEVIKPVIDRAEIEESEQDTTNKHLTGLVTELSPSRITIKTNKNRSWTFQRQGSTRTTGGNLEKGCKVRITYDGYASQIPPAKEIKVLSAPDPTPKTHKTSGVVRSFGGMELFLDSGFHCDCAGAKITGDGNREPGDYATVTYYTENGENYATKIHFEMLVY